MRLFIALDLPSEVKKNLNLIIKDFNDIRGLRFADPENSHLTLLFIGESDNQEAIKEKLKQIRFEPFYIKTDKLGYFEHYNKLKVFWLGLSKSGELIALQKQIQDLLPFVKPDFDQFNPHLTIARANPDVDANRLKEKISRYNIPASQIKVDSVKLYSSDLRHGKPAYTMLAKFDAKK